MLSLQSFLREGRVVGPCWEKLKPKGPKGPKAGIRGWNSTIWYQYSPSVQEKYKPKQQQQVSKIKVKTITTKVPGGVQFSLRKIKVKTTTAGFKNKSQNNSPGVLHPPYQDRTVLKMYPDRTQSSPKPHRTETAPAIHCDRSKEAEGG